jgi:GT2 family glycosyltransferase
MIHIVIPVFNAREFLNDCLSSLIRQTYQEFAVIVVDDGSRDGTGEFIRKNFPDIAIVEGTGDWWWAKSMNEGVALALTRAKPGDFILSLNIDLYVKEDYLERLIQLAEGLSPCVVGSVSVDQDEPDRAVFTGVKWNRWTARYKLILPMKIFREKALEYGPTATLPGRGTLYPIEAFQKAGLYDSERYPQYFADDEMSLRAERAGFRLLVCPHARVFSNVRATGLNFKVSGDASFAKFWESLWTLRSPFYLKVRFKFAMAYGKIGPLYFALDLARICTSYVLFRIRARKPPEQSLAKDGAYAN